MELKTKTCTKCKGEFPATAEHFHRQARISCGLGPICKLCAKTYKAKHHKENPTLYRERQRKYNRENPEKMRQVKADWYQANREQKDAANKKYKKDNPEIQEWYNAYMRERYATNATFRLSRNFSGKIRASIVDKNGCHWENLVDYTLEDLREHLEAQFQPGMTWDNYGQYGWHIDHIKPVSLFNFESHEDEEFKECWALDNLQPLWAKDNLSKGNKY